LFIILFSQGVIYIFWRDLLFISNKCFRSEGHDVEWQRIIFEFEECLHIDLCVGIAELVIVLQIILSIEVFVAWRPINYEVIARFSEIKYVHYGPSEVDGAVGIVPSMPVIHFDDPTVVTVVSGQVPFESFDQPQVSWCKVWLWNNHF